MWEANYARYLNWLVEQNQIRGWEFEAEVFVFHGVTRGAHTYRPDFKVQEVDGRIVYHEVKGWMDGPSKTRLKRMKKYYPEVEVIVIGEGEYKAIAKWCKALIPEWESKR
jgi:predicted nuclease of restriction endonuclease-like RecB superfamily